MRIPTIHFKTKRAFYCFSRWNPNKLEGVKRFEVYKPNYQGLIIELGIVQLVRVRF